MLFGLFAVIAGVLLMLERYGIIPADVQWGAPMFIIFFGIGSIYSAVKGRSLNGGDSKVEP